MESLGVPLMDRGPTLVGEHGQGLGELNRRLEAYLARVQTLQGEHSRLREEVAHLRQVRGGETPWGAEEVRVLRARLEEEHRVAHRVRLSLEGLRDEARRIQGLCMRERLAREEAVRALEGGRRALEVENRALTGLRALGAQLEGDLAALKEAHREELDHLSTQKGVFALDRPFPTQPKPPTAPLQVPPEVEDYARLVEGLWMGALQGYKEEVARLQNSLDRGRDGLRRVTQEGRQDRLRLQQLQREMEALRARKGMLEEGIARLWQRQQGGAQKMQVAIGALEEEKQGLRTQIRQVLEDRQQLMQLKMSLSLEVATYKSLLEAESARMQVPITDYRTTSGLWDAKLAANPSKLRAAPLDGHRDFNHPKPKLAKNQQDSPPASLASMLPQDPIACEFQADPALQLPPMNGFDEVWPNQEVLSLVEVAPQISFHEPPVMFGAISPEKEESLSLEQGLQEDGGEAASPVGEEEEETPILPMSYPTQLVTEALEIALQEMNGEDPQLGSDLLHVPKTPNDVSLSGEEENGEDLPTNVGLEEEAVPEQLPKTPSSEGYGPTEHLEEHGEVMMTNGDQEAWVEPQELGTGVWVDQGADLALPQETGLLEEDGGPYAMKSQEESVAEAPSGEMDSDKERSSREENQAQMMEKTSTLQSGGQETPVDEDPIVLLGQEVPILPWDGEKNQEPGPSCLPYKEELEMVERELEESEGGAEDLDVVSTEALNLSEEDEERRELWSPSRDSSDLQTENPESEELTMEQMPPISCPALSTVEEVPLCVPDFTLPEEEDGPEEVAEVLAVSADQDATMKDMASPGVEGSFALVGEPRSPKSTENVEGIPGEDVLGNRGSHKSESVLDGEDVESKEGVSAQEVVSTPDGTGGLDSVLEPEGIPGLADSEGGQKQEPEREQKVEEEGEVGGDGDVRSEEWVRNGGVAGTGSAEEAVERMDHGGAESGEEQESYIQHDDLQPEPSTDTCPAEDTEETEGDAALLGPDPAPFAQSLVCDVVAATEVNTEGQGDAVDEPQEHGEGSPEGPTEVSPISSLQSLNDISKSEDSLECVDAFHNADRIEPDLECGRRIALEDTLPDHTPLHLYRDQVVGEENEEVADPFMLGEEGSASVQQEDPKMEEGGKEQGGGAVGGSGGAEEEGGYGEEHVPSQASPCGEEPVVPENFIEEPAEVRGDNGNQPVIDPEMSKVEEALALLEEECSQGPGELPKTRSDAERETEAGEQGMDVAGELENVFQTGELDLIQEGTFEGEDVPLECCAAGNQKAEGAAKLSPLTSVADLGEIVLDGGLLPEVLVESQEVVFYQEEGLGPVHESQPISDLEICGGDAAWGSAPSVQMGVPAREEPTANEAGPDPSPETTGSFSNDGMKDSDILEIVEQALEFSQEMIKAAEQGMELPVPEKGMHDSPEEEEGPPYSTTSPSMEDSNPSQTSEDPPEPIQSWTKNNTNGLPLDTPSVENGVGESPQDSMAVEDGLSAKKVTFTQQCLEEEVTGVWEPLPEPTHQ